MNRTLALALATVLSACAHAGSGGAAAPSGTANRQRHAVPAIIASAGLESSAVPQVFEQTFCSALFELNDKQVICADDMRAFMRIQHEKALLGSPGLSVQETEAVLEAPRRVNLTAEPRGEKISVTVTVQDAKAATLLRHVLELKADGSDISAKARDAAARVAYLP